MLNSCFSLKGNKHQRCEAEQREDEWRRISLSAFPPLIIQTEDGLHLQTAHSEPENISKKWVLLRWQMDAELTEWWRPVMMFMFQSQHLITKINTFIYMYCTNIWRKNAQIFTLFVSNNWIRYKSGSIGININVFFCLSKNHLQYLSMLIFCSLCSYGSCGS